MQTTMNHTLAVVLALVSCIGCQQRSDSGTHAQMAEVRLIRKALMARSEGTSSQPSTETKVEPTGWGTMTGRIQLVGEPPKNPPLDVRGSDAEICAPGGSQVVGEEVVVGPDGGLKNVVVYLNSEISDSEPWTHPDARAGRGEPVVFDQKECLFLSHAAGVRVGQPLLIKNSDPIGHNTNVQTKDNPSFNQTIPANGETKLVFNVGEKGPVPVSCSIHPFMKASLLVHANGYFAVTDESGNFEIPNLPAGVDLEFRIWQEKVGFLSGVNVGDQKINKGRFNMVINADDPAANQINLQLDASLFN